MAILLVRLGKGSKITSPFEGLVDSGATYCLFHADIAAEIGIEDFRSGKRCVTGSVIEGAEMDLYAHDVWFHVASDSFKITGYFADRLPIPCILGRLGFFDKYIVTFDPTDISPGFELTRIHKA